MGQWDNVEGKEPLTMLAELLPGIIIACWKKSEIRFDSSVGQNLPRRRRNSTPSKRREKRGDIKIEENGLNDLGSRSFTGWGDESETPTGVGEAFSSNLEAERWRSHDKELADFAPDDCKNLGAVLYPPWRTGSRTYGRDFLAV